MLLVLLLELAVVLLQDVCLLQNLVKRFRPEEVLGRFLECVHLLVVQLRCEVLLVRMADQAIDFREGLPICHVIELFHFGVDSSGLTPRFCEQRPRVLRRAEV